MIDNDGAAAVPKAETALFRLEFIVRFGRHRVETSYSGRSAWLGAAVLGANDGILSTASLIVAIANSGATRQTVMVAGAAGLLAGALSMAAGEFVSVSSQADLERADLGREAEELRRDPAGEERELASLFVDRGADKVVADRLAGQLSKHDALGAHAREELRLSPGTKAKPLTAALASATSFALGAVVPLVVVLTVPIAAITSGVIAASLGVLSVLGAVGAYAGGASLVRGVIRVVTLGAVAMGITIGLGRMLGAAL
jgi:VIT1/CCC1 family predicted Fe2+/Mn2+ transporter